MSCHLIPFLLSLRWDIKEKNERKRFENIVRGLGLEIFLFCKRDVETRGVTSDFFFFFPENWINLFWSTYCRKTLGFEVKSQEYSCINILEFKVDVTCMEGKCIKLLFVRMGAWMRSVDLWDTPRDGVQDLDICCQEGRTKSVPGLSPVEDDTVAAYL